MNFLKRVAIKLLPSVDLWTAAKKGDRVAIRRLASAGCDINARKQTLQSEGNTPLHFAAEYGQTAAIHELLELGADVNAKDNAGGTPLMLAVFERQKDRVLDALIDSGANVNAQRRDGLTALCLAASLGDLRLIRYLLAHKADPNVGTPKKRACPLAQAAWSNRFEAVKMLIDAGASVNQPGPDRAFPLRNAVARKNVAVVEILLRAGADPNLREHDERIPLMVSAVRCGELRVVKQLLEAKANPNFEDDATGSTALDIAYETKRKDIVEILEGHGAQKGSKSTRWKTVAEELRQEFVASQKSNAKRNKRAGG